MERVYQIKPAVIAPILATLVIIVIACRSSAWWIVGIPFAILGTICGQPNLNLANGCLAYLAVIIGLMIAPFHSEIGYAIAFSSYGGLILGAIEKSFFAVSLEDEGQEIHNEKELNSESKNENSVHQKRTPR